MGPLEVRSWDLLYGIGGVPDAGSCPGGVADAEEGLGGVPSADSCLDVASTGAMVVVMNCDWNCLNLYTSEGKRKVWSTHLVRCPFDFIMCESEAE